MCTRYVMYLCKSYLLTLPYFTLLSFAILYFTYIHLMESLFGIKTFNYSSMKFIEPNSSYFYTMLLLTYIYKKNKNKKLQQQELNVHTYLHIKWLYKMIYH